MFGQLASWQTVCRLFFLIISFVSEKIPEFEILTLIHSGFLGMGFEVLLIFSGWRCFILLF